MTEKTAHKYRAWLRSLIERLLFEEWLQPRKGWRIEIAGPMVTQQNRFRITLRTPKGKRVSQRVTPAWIEEARRDATVQARAKFWLMSRLFLQAVR